MESDLISRQAAYDALMAEPLKWDDSSVWERARCHQWMMDMCAIKALPSAQSDIAEKLYLCKCYVTDEEGLQHEVIHTGDIRRITGWEI